MAENQNINTLELKKILFQRIAEIQDVVFLNTIRDLLDSKSETIFLTEKQKEEIDFAKKEIENGDFFTQDQIDEEFKQWEKAK